MRTLHRIHAAFGVDLNIMSHMLTCAQGMYNGLNADKVTYASPNPSLPVFLGLIQSCTTSHQAVSLRTRGAAATRGIQRGLLLTGMENERMYVQSLADGDPTHAVALIQNAGLVVAAEKVHHKALLTLRQGKVSGSLLCEANVGVLKSALMLRPTQGIFYNWAYTVDGAKSFIPLPPTTTGKTTITGLTPLTTVGVRVNLNGADGPGDWSQVFYTLVH